MDQRWRWWCLLSALCFLSPNVGRAAERANIVVILADDLGSGDLGCYGHPKHKTPVIDQLARDGARLTSFYAPVPYCAPTRGSLLTGRYPFRNGLFVNPVPFADAKNKSLDEAGLPVGEITLANLLSKAGYATGCFGKWHLGHQPPFLPTRRGFDEYYGLLYSNDMHPVELFDGDNRIEYPVVQTSLTQRLTDRAIAFLDRNKSRPFFLYFPQVAVHKPLAPAERFYQKSGAGLYGDMVAELDWSVGQVMAKLKELQLEQNTLVIFASDNGPWYGGSSGGLRGMKGDTTEGGVRVPLIARLPGRIPSGHMSAEPAIMMDLFPTILAAAEVKPPRDLKLDGKDIMPLLTTSAASPHEAIYSFKNHRLHAVRSGKWRLHIASPIPPNRKPLAPTDSWIDPRRPDGVRLLAPYEQAHPSQYPGRLVGQNPTVPALFDLEADPGEDRNLIKEQPAVAERLQGLCRQLQAEMEKVRPK